MISNVTDLPPIKINEELKIIKKTYFRGYIQSKEAAYYILNEIVSGDYTKVFSAVRISISGKDKILEGQRLCVRYISKEWIKQEIFVKLQIHEERVKKFFDSLRKKFESYRKIKHNNIQELKDYIEDEEGIYIVLEFCDYTLRDYVQILREPVKFSRFPFELKVRKMIIQILETIYYVHSEVVSMCFGGLLNSSDIMITEISESSHMANSYLVKFPHPFMLDLFTIIKIYNIERFPSYYAPEIYKLFESNEVAKVIDKKDSFDLSSLMSKINHNMDMWSLGYLLFEILFEDPPFIFDDLSSAVKSIDLKFEYKIYPKRISKKSLELINSCLQLDPQDRLKSDYMYEIKNEMKKENDSFEDLEKNLRERMTDKKDYEMIVSFNLTSLINYEKI